MTIIVLQLDNGELNNTLKKRTVRPHHKSKLGCLTCRKRRIKCDERYPCTRCILAKLQCPGVPQHPSSQIAQLTKGELHSLQFYREQTSPGLGGHFDGDFWTAVVLRLSYSHKALQHFVIAVGSLDEAYRIRSWSSNGSEAAVSLYSFGLEQYGKAIQTLVQQSEDKSTALIALVSSLICQVFEIWLGDMYSARSHVMAARRLLTTSHFQSLQTGTEEQHIMSGYLNQMLHRNCSEFSLPPPDTKAPFGDDYAHIFQGHGSPKKSLNVLSEDLIGKAKTYIANSSGPELRSHLTDLQRELDAWYRELLLRDHSGNVWRGLWSQCRCLVEIRYRVYRICLIVVPMDDELLYDDFIKDFEATVDACERFLQTASESQHGTRRAIDHTTTLTLMFVGSSCRDPLIRRRAIGLLYRYLRLEGLWSSIATGVYAERLMKLEEEPLGKVEQASDIPRHARVRGLSMRYDPGELLDHFTSGQKTSKTRLPISQYEESMYKRTPAVTIGFCRPHSEDNEERLHSISIRSVDMMSCFGLKTTIWFPADQTPVMTEDQGNAGDVHQTYDGPHIDRKPWTVYQNHDLESFCNMRFVRIQFDDDYSVPN